MSETPIDGRQPSIKPTAVIDSWTAAEDAARLYCGDWHIAPIIDEVVTLDGTGTEFLFLPSIRVRDIYQMTVNGQLIDVSTLEWTESGIVKAPMGRWPDKYRCITVGMTHGFEAYKLASIIQQIADRLDSIPKGIASASNGSQSIRYSRPDLTDSEKRLLDQFKLPGRGVR